MHRSPPVRAGRRAVLAAATLVLLAVTPATARDVEKNSTVTYTSFDALTATIWREDGRRGVLTVQGGLDVQDAALRARTAQSGPLLRDAYVRVLNVYAAGLTPGAPPDVDQIELRLQQATDRVLKRPGARVLLGTVLVN